MTPRLISIPADRYHADDIGEDRPSLSSSLARTLITESPKHGWYRHPKLGNVARTSTAEQERGTLIHSLILQPDDALNQIVLIAADNFKTKAAQEARDGARAQGMIPVLEKHFEEACNVAEAIRHALAAADLALTGQSEVVAVWEEETARGPILCRGMLDHLFLDRGVIIDLKTCSCAHPLQLGRRLIEHGYDIQYAAYTSAYRKLRPDLAGREDFLWVFVEELPEEFPDRVMVTFGRPDGILREHGRSRWARACETWARCLRDNHWPGYAERPVTIEAPSWAIKQELGAE